MKPEIVETNVQPVERHTAATGPDADRRRFLRTAGKLGLAGPAVAVLLTVGNKPTHAGIGYTE